MSVRGLTVTGLVLSGLYAASKIASLELEDELLLSQTEGNRRDTHRFEYEFSYPCKDNNPSALLIQAECIDECDAYFGRGTKYEMDIVVEKLSSISSYKVNLTAWKVD